MAHLLGVTEAPARFAGQFEGQQIPFNSIVMVAGAGRPMGAQCLGALGWRLLRPGPLGPGQLASGDQQLTGEGIQPVLLGHAGLHCIKDGTERSGVSRLWASRPAPA